MPAVAACPQGDEVEIEIGQYNAQIKSLTCTELFSYSHVADAWRMETVEGC